MKPQKKFYIFQAIISLSILMVLDLGSKTIAFALHEPVHFGLLNIIPVTNSGFVFGAFSEFKNLVRVIFFSTLGGYALALFFIILYFLKNRSLFWMKASMTIFVGGILGNVIDKTIFGYVRDFINIDIGPFAPYAFNVADIYLVTGTIFMIIYIFKYGDELWNENNSRKTYLIDKPYQLTIAFWNISALLFACVTLSLYSYSFLKSYIDPHLQIGKQVYKYFFIGLVLIVLIYSAIFFLFTLILTHRSAGPLVAFQRFIDRLQSDQNNEEKLTLREDDFHKELEDIADTILELRKQKDK